MDQLSLLYVELEDYRGMVQLYEDQILRGKEPAVRAELARNVARLWQEKLGDTREAADAWRRVLRMKAGDAEAVAGLELAKANMLKRSSEAPSEPRHSEPPALAETVAKPTEAAAKPAPPSKDKPAREAAAPVAEVAAPPEVPAPAEVKEAAPAEVKETAPSVDVAAAPETPVEAQA